MGIKTIVKKSIQKIRATPRGLKKCWWLLRSKIGTMKNKLHHERRHRALRNKKWFLVLGEPGSGKKTMLANSGLTFIRPEHIGSEALFYQEQFPDYDWWFSKEAIFIDAMTEPGHWKPFIKLLKRERRHKPLHGIIVTMALPSLMTLSHQKRQDLVQIFCNYWRKIYESFKAHTPVYLILTKCDQIEGFMEFFNDLSKEELQQIWGCTFPLNAGHQAFNEDYAALIAQLRKRILWSFDTERSERGRELINNFPQQMQLLKKPIEHFILELVAGTRHHDALLLRGLYFVSNTQSGNTHSFLLQALSKKFQLVPPQLQTPQRMQESYFSKRLFPELIFPESNFLGESERSRKLKRLGRLLLKVGLPLLIVFSFFISRSAYEHHLNTISEAQASLQDYEQDLNTVKTQGYDFASMASAFTDLKNAYQFYHHDDHWNSSLLASHFEIEHALYAALQRNLHAYLLPKIAANLESNLNQNIDDQNVLYATLKGYLAFSEQSHTAATALLAPMAIEWDKQYHPESKTTTELKNDLTLAIQEPIEKLPLDSKLIKHIRDELSAVVPADRAYGLLSLRASVGALPSLNLPSQIGEHFSSVFFDDAPTIPALYTQAGFKKIFLQEAGSIAAEVAHDNQDIGLSENDLTEKQLLESLERTYNKNYIQAWDGALTAITVKPFNTPSDTVNALNLILSNQSPLTALLRVMKENTQNIQGEHINVSTLYEKINAFSSSWSKIKESLQTLRAFLNQIAKAPDMNKAAFAAVQSIIAGQDNPFNTLQKQADQSPLYIKTWLTDIVHNSWNVLVASALTEMNAQWKTQVLEEYNNTIAGRYPIDPHASSQISITDFNHFFGPQGTLELYFNTVLKPFINTTQQPWALYNNHGYSVPLSREFIAQWQTIADIQKYYFPNKGAAQLEFNLEPMNLSAGAKSITLGFGDQTITYRHGPHTSTSISWPINASDNQESYLLLNTFNDHNREQHRSGPWSLFQILNLGTLTPLSNTGSYQLDYHLGQESAQFLLQSNDPARIFHLRDLLNFKLPETINEEPHD